MGRAGQGPITPSSHCASGASGGPAGQASEVTEEE